MNARRALWQTTGAGAFVIALTMAWQHAPLFVWNASESVPVGLYAVRPSSVLTIDELVVVRPSETLADLPGRRRISAQRLAASQAHRGIARQQSLSQRASRHSGWSLPRHGPRARPRRRMLPTWTGCRSLGRGEVFLLNESQPSSLDGRYFGPPFEQQHCRPGTPCLDGSWR